MTLYTIVDSPIGELLLSGDEHALHGLWMQDGPRGRAGRDRDPAWRRADEPFAAAREQLGAYFGGERTAFDLPLVMDGTPFQQVVWAALREIPYGETTSYGVLARRMGTPDAVRAVGLANGRNPISVIVPCHRVIGANGDLTGFGGGLERKRLLLELESPAQRLAPAEAQPVWPRASATGASGGHAAERSSAARSAKRRLASDPRMNRSG